MKPYEYFLLDWDGTLARTLDVWLESLRRPLIKRGYTLNDAEIGANFTVFKTRMQKRDMPELDEILKEADEIAVNEVPNVSLYPDVSEVLEYLRTHGKRIALVTTSTHAHIDPLLRKYRLSQLFDAVVCGDEVVNNKPDAEPLNKALKLLRGTKEKAVMIGDSGSDIMAATAAGIDSVLFYPPAHSTFYNLEELKLLHPTFVMADFKELLQLV